MIRLAVLLICLAGPVLADSLKLAVTTSFENSGLADVLLPAVAEETGLEVQLLVVGTGQALRLGAAGDVDAVLVHARPAEDAFVADGHAPHRRDIMANDFVLIGPASDPAGIAEAATATEALFRIAESGSAFVSRGDDSGTHQAELSLWRALGMDPASLGAAYSAVGAGMGAALNTAAGLDAYILADRASWLNFGNPANLTLLFDGDPAMRNPYGFLPVSPDKGAHINHDAALMLEDWLTGDRGRALINGYRLQGQQVFFAATD